MAFGPFIAATAQPDTTMHTQVITFGAGAHKGFIGDPAYQFQHLIRGYPLGLYTSLQKVTYAKNSFALETGMRFFYLDMENPQQLGYLVGVLPFYMLRYGLSPRWQVSATTGLGVLYNSKPYHPINNYKNTLLGSHFNTSLLGGLAAHFNVSKSISLTAGGQVMHFSNGNTTSPNDGINLFSVETGILYHLHRQKMYTLPRNTQMPPTNSLFFTMAMSLTDYQRNVQKGYHFYTFMAEWIKPINPWFGLGAGIDFTVNDGHTDKVLYDWNLPGVHHQVGVKAVLSAMVQRTQVLFQAGVINDVGLRGYNYIILRYHFLKRFHLNMSYRSYGFSGGHLSWGGGVKIER